MNFNILDSITKKNQQHEEVYLLDIAVPDQRDSLVEFVPPSFAEEYLSKQWQIFFM